MKTIKTALTLIVLTILFTTTSCTKEGEKGEQGEAGQNGNANVQSTTLTATSWSWDASNFWRTVAWNNVSILNGDVINSGSVMLYQNVGGNSYVALPITQGTATTVENDFFVFSLNRIDVFIENTNLSDPINQIPIPTSYRLVTVPSSARLSNLDLDWKDYEKVKKRFNLKEPSIIYSNIN